MSDPIGKLNVRPLARSPVPCCDDVEDADEAAVPARDALADEAACIAPCLGGIDFFFFLFSEAESNILPSALRQIQ